LIIDTDHGRRNGAQTTASAAGAELQGRSLLIRHLRGSGLELGPGHAPFPVPLPAINVRYVDRWLPDENRDLFPELSSEQGFPVPDVIANFDVDRLHAIPDSSEDFIICSHVLEHLADPIGFLDEIHRVIRPGGVVLILLPDRRRTWDRDREPTSLAHLVKEHQSNVTEVDDEHIVEFLRGTHKYLGNQSEPIEISIQDPAYLEKHRRRSVHVHCWDNGEFSRVIRYGIDDLNHKWDFVDGLLTEEAGPDNIEFGFVLRRLETDLEMPGLGDRFTAIWHAWRAAKLAELAALDDARSEWSRIQTTAVGLNEQLIKALTTLHDANLQLESLHTQLRETRQELDRTGHELDQAHADILAIQKTRTFRYTASIRRTYANLRQRVSPV
jgi:SAM-dependent methyltransferase